MSGLDDLRNKLAALPKEELVEIAQATVALEQREADKRARDYIPNQKVEEFIAMIGNGNTFVSLLSAANGVGKTTAGANLVMNICFGVQNKYFDLPIFRNWPYLRRGRIVSDPTTIREKIIPELKKWLPPGRYTFSKEGKAYESKLITETGWIIDLMTYEQDVKEFESVDLGWIWFDEPPPRPIYRASVGRGRRGMVMIMTLTPLTYSAWIKDDIVDEADKEEEMKLIVRQKRYLTADIEDNCKQHGVRGFLDHDDIIKMLAEYPEDEREARAHGRFGHLMGRVHKIFDPKVHVIKPFAINSKDYAVYHFLDPHPRTPDAGMWIAVDRNNQFYIVDELWMKGNTKDLAYEIKKKEKGMSMRIEGRWIDPSAYTEDKHLERSLAGELEKYDLFYQPGSKELGQGIKLTDEALHYVAKNGMIITKPQLFVFNHCERTIWEFKNYIWDEWQGRMAVEKNPKPKVKDANDHMMENIHRACLAMISFVPMVRETGSTGEVASENLDPYAR